MNNFVSILKSFLGLLIISVYLANGQELVFDSKELQFDDGTLNRELKISLKTQPVGNVFVGIKVSNAKIFSVSQCNLVFSPANFSTPVSVVVQADNTPSLKKRTVRGTLQFDIVSEDNLGRKCNLKHASLNLIREFNPPSHCSSTGDPHITTFDGEKYDYSGKEGKTYYLVDSPNTSIQTQMYNCRQGKAFCNLQFGVRHYDATLTIRINRASNSNQFPQSAAILKSGSDKNLITFSLSQNTFNIKLQDGTRIKVSGSYRQYLSIYVTVPGSYYGRVSGLCGNNNGHPTHNILASIQGNPPETKPIDNIFECGACGAMPFPSGQVPLKFGDCKPNVFHLDDCKPIHTTTTPPPPVYTTTTEPPPPIYTTTTPPPPPPIYTTTPPVPPPVYTTTPLPPHPVYSSVPPPVYTTAVPPVPPVYSTVPPPVYVTISHPPVTTCPPLPPPSPEPYCDEEIYETPVVAGITSFDMPADKNASQESQTVASAGDGLSVGFGALVGTFVMALIIAQ